MSKNKTGRRSKRAVKSVGKRKAFLVIGLALSLIITGGALAHWSSVFSSGQNQSNKGGEVTPESMLPGSPSKEYVYAGSRLVATEEPAASPGCAYSISPTSRSIDAAGGTGNVTVTAGTGCTWTASSNAPSWLHATSGASGSGNGSVGYSVDPNGGGPRGGTITIAGLSFNVNQDPASSCSYMIAPPSQNFTASGGTGTVNVTAGAGCSWTASTTAAWITVQPPAGGTSSGSISFTVAANSGQSRNDTITVAGKIVTVTQDAGGGATCSYSIAPPSSSTGAGGGNGSFNVMAGGGCGWTATSSVTWITIQPPATGSGNGTVSYSVGANSGGPRSGSITVGGQTFSVSQNGAGGPPAPTGLTATLLTATSVRLDWSFAPDGISIFKIERKTGAAGTYSQIATADNGARSFSNTKLQARTTYCYRVRAYNGQDGPYSNEACATTP